MKKIFISAGHGGGDPGAAANGKTEAAVVLEFRDIVAHYLGVAQVAFSTDGEKGENKPLRDAVKMFSKRDVAVEFHLNAAASPVATGVETLSAEKDKAFGADICRVVSSQLGIANRGAKGESSGQHSRLAFVQAGGVIVELFFITNKNDLAAYEAVKWVLAKEIAKALVKEASKG